MRQATITDKITALQKKITHLETSIIKIEKYITYMQLGEFGHDPAYFDTLNLIQGRKHVSFNWLQRKLDVGYARTQRILDRLEKEGKIAPKINGRKKRKVI